MTQLLPFIATPMAATVYVIGALCRGVDDSVALCLNSIFPRALSGRMLTRYRFLVNTDSSEGTPVSDNDSYPTASSISAVLVTKHTWDSQAVNKNCTGLSFPRR